MKKVILLLNCVLGWLLSNAQVPGDYQSTGTVDLNSVTNWQVYSNGSWVTASAAPNGNVSSGNTITIQSSNTWNNASAATIPVGVTLIFQGTAGTFSSSNTIQLNGIYVHFTAAAAATVYIGMSINTGSIFIYRASSTVKPTATLTGKTYYNLSFDTDGTTSTNPTFSAPGISSPLTINGTLTVNNWGIDLYSSGNTGATNFNGDVVLTGTNTYLGLKPATIATGHTLTIGATDSLFVTASTLTVNGTLINQSTKSIYANKSSGTMVVNGTYKHDVNGGSIPSAGVTYSAGSTINITGVTSGTGSPAAVPGLPATIAGNVIWNCPGQTVTNTFYGSASSITIGGDFNLVSTGTGTIYMGGGGTARTLTVNGNINISGGNLKLITSTGSANQTCNVTGNLTISAGSFLISDATLTGVGSLSISGNINHTAGTFGIGVNAAVKTGTLILSGSNAQTITSTGATVGNLTVNNANGVTISSGLLTVTNTLTLQNGVLTTGNNLVLASSSTNGSASIITVDGTTNKGSVSGNVIVQRYVGSNNVWRMVGFPFAGSSTIAASNLASFYSGGYNAYTYNENGDDLTNYGNSGSANAGWVKFVSGITTANNGILLVGGASSIINLAGALNIGSTSIPVTNTKAGWNFIANPYASNISWTSLYNANNSNLAATVYRYNPSSTAYATYNATTASSVNNQGDVIENGAGFFVQASSTGNINVTESIKTISSITQSMMNADINTRGSIVVNGVNERASASNSIIKFSLSKEGDQYADEVIVRWGGGYLATDNFDNKYDAYDLGRKKGPDLSVIGNDATQYSIFHGSELKNNVDENRTVQLGIKNIDEGSYQIGIQLQAALANGNKAYLYDNYTGLYTLIDGNTTTYHFTTTSDVKSQSITRFSIIINAKGVNVDNANTNNTMLLLNNPTSTNQFTIYSKNSYSQLSYQVVDNFGKALQNGLFSNVAKGSVHAIQVNNVVSGIYFIKLIGDDQKITVLKAVKN